MVSYRGAAAPQSIPELVWTTNSPIPSCVTYCKAYRCCQALESRRLAVEEIEKLLHSPDDLKLLNVLLEDYRTKHEVCVVQLYGCALSRCSTALTASAALPACPLQANKAQLSASVATQVEAARSGMTLLERAHTTLGNMQSSYKVSAALLCAAVFSTTSTKLPACQSGVTEAR